MKKASYKLRILTFIASLLKSSVIIIGTLFLVEYITIAFFRMRYPFELELLEGNMLVSVQRVITGLKIYVRPSMEFVPYYYPPLYFYFSAIFVKIFGLNFFSLRLVSFISSIVSVIIIYSLVKRETKSKFAGLISSCLFTASYGASGAWFDVARVDSLFLAFVLLAIYLMRFKNSLPSNILTGIFLSLAIFTKQTATIIILPILLFFLLVKRKKAFLIITTIIIIVSIGSLALNILYDGWYFFYVWKLPHNNPLIFVSITIDYWRNDIFGRFLFAFILGIFYLISKFIGKEKLISTFYLSVLMGAIITSWFGRLYAGGGHNALLPIHAVIAIIFGIALTSIPEKFQFKSHQNTVNLISLYLIGLIQFIVLLYNPVKLIPTKRDKLKGKMFLETMAQLKGDIYINDHQYLNHLVGKKSFADRRAMLDVIREDPKGEGKRLKDDLLQTIKEREFSAIISDPENLPIVVNKYYEKQNAVYKTIFWDSGNLNEYLYIPI